MIALLSLLASIIITNSLMHSLSSTKSKSLFVRSARSAFARSSFCYQSNESPRNYDHAKVERKWQQFWEDSETFVARRRLGKEKKYVLDMFPYPSGSGLHVGHPLGYTATDIMARYWRMQDFDVLHPMGWDAFGLPAEQHAINTGTHPAVTTNENIANFKRQLKSLGFSFDWSRELSTTDTHYLQWTQWLFLKLFENGLAEQRDVDVNWCPALGTILANEEVENGLSERGGHPVVRVPLRQWVLKITNYADQLLDGLKEVDWPTGTKSAQEKWIGKSTGAFVKFKILAADGESTGEKKDIEVFTTRPDTLMGVTYLVLAPESDLVPLLVTNEYSDLVKEYSNATASKSDLERTAVGQNKAKTGVPLGRYALHPISGERIPIWTADYVLANYGTGAVMGVPAHDERDYAFAKQFDLQIKQVVFPLDERFEEKENVELSGKPMLKIGIVRNSGTLMDGLSSAAAGAAVISSLQSSNMGREGVSYKLRDWVFSRQRYWGEPIPIYFPVEMLSEVESGSPLNGDQYKIRYDQPIAVSETDLPLRLPHLENITPGDDPQGCLAQAPAWRFFKKDQKWFARETNTMPQWAGSCWYYLRFVGPSSSETFSVGKDTEKWLPVDLYVGGKEHAVLHLLYARFWHKVLYDLKIVSDPEPFPKLVHQGMILGADGEKMSKSKGNVVNPDDIIDKFGADALRLYLMFMGPLEALKPWQSNQVTGVVRFRDHLFKLATGPVNRSPILDETEQTIREDMHKTIKKVTDDLNSMNFNTAISAMMIFANKLSSEVSESGIPPSFEAVKTLILLVSPFAPHMAEEAWQLLTNSAKDAPATNHPVQSIAYEPWPVYDASLCEPKRVTIAIQVNGKVRGRIEMGVDIVNDTEVLELAMQHQNVARYICSPVKQCIFVPGKILNILV